MYRDNTKVIKIGNRVIGGGNPVLIQSMTNTPTEDVKSTVDQILRLEKAGCEIIRCTVPDEAAAKALKKAYELSTSVKIGVRDAMSLYMQGKMQQFEMVLQELQTNHRNDPQLEPLNSLLLPQQIKKS